MNNIQLGILIGLVLVGIACLLYLSLSKKENKEGEQ